MAYPSLARSSTIFLALSLLAIPLAFSPLHHKLFCPAPPLLPPPPPHLPPPSFLSPSSNVKATGTDVINLLGSKTQASAVNPTLVEPLRSCFQFLVPSVPSQSDSNPIDYSTGRSLTPEEEDERIWRPPPAVLELARLAVEAGRDAIVATLDPRLLDLPDIQGAKKDHCSLNTREPIDKGRRFMNAEVNSYFKFMFELIVSRFSLYYDVSVSLSRYDLFHGHVFLAHGSNRLGILFHAREYPAFDPRVFPEHLGPCQTGSNIRYDEYSMNLRNILWLAPMPDLKTRDWDAPGVLVALDARPNGIIYKDIIPDYAHIVRTIYEENLGKVVFDVDYFDPGKGGNDPIYICG